MGVGIKIEEFGPNNNVVALDLFTPEAESLTGVVADQEIPMGTILGRVATVGELVIVTDANQATITQYYVLKRKHTVPTGKTAIDVPALAMGSAVRSLTNIDDLTAATLIELDMNRTGLYLVSSITAALQV